MRCAELHLNPITNMTLPPLLPIAPLLSLQLPALSPPTNALKPLPAPSLSQRSQSGRADGDAKDKAVQVLLPAPDDNAARLLFISAGVFFASAGLVPTIGVMCIHAPASPGGQYAYRWRA